MCDDSVCACLYVCVCRDPGWRSSGEGVGLGGSAWEHYHWLESNQSVACPPLWMLHGFAGTRSTVDTQDRGDHRSGQAYDVDATDLFEQFTGLGADANLAELREARRNG